MGVVRRAHFEYTGYIEDLSHSTSYLSDKPSQEQRETLTCVKLKGAILVEIRFIKTLFEWWRIRT